ncbi:SAM-dependent methyltransferase [bacterium]|nr:MAG: SAM-dependent methyltransferase [bacterium]
MTEPDSSLAATSFRDPAGRVIRKNGKVFRQVFPAGSRDYEAARDSGLFTELIKRGWLIPHRELPVAELNGWPGGAAYILEPEQLDWVSYPYEWAFSAYKEAALLTLDAQQLALEKGFILKDASAYNVQFWQGRPVLIDTLSFEPYAGNRAWQAYGQFCRHFLAPLALMTKVDIRLSCLMRDFIDGLPLDLAAATLPTRSKIRPGLMLHLSIHSSSQRRYANKPVKQVIRRDEAGQKLARQSLLGLTDSLRRTVKGLRLPRGAATEWGKYYSFTNYSDAAAAHKAELVREYTQLVKPVEIWDLGGNDGRFSREALAAGAQRALCFDIDPLAVEKNYRYGREQAETALTPLLLDATNPSPGIGWANAERPGLNERAGDGKGRMLLALAVIHHLAISNNLPFGHIAKWLAGLGEHLVIEFVPKDDSKVQTLLATRKDIFDQYDQSVFEQTFRQYFTILQQTSVRESGRQMYLMQRKRP